MQNLLTGPFIKINQNDYVAGMATDLKEREVNERSRDDQGKKFFYDTVCRLVGLSVIIS